MKTVKIKNIPMGGQRPLVFIAGPCVLEDEKTVFTIVETLIEVTESLGAGLVFKASYDKANRTSIKSYRGPGLKKGIKTFEKIKKRYNVPILTDVHCVSDCKPLSEAVDCLQIPAFLCRQTDLLLAAGKTGLPVNIKKGQFMAPDSMKEAVKKVLSTGNDSVMLTERGVSFGYNKLVGDFRRIR